MSRQPLRCVIIGGGISGLAAAHRLLELSRAQSTPLALTVLEAGSQLGGVIETRHREGFLLESGPDAFLGEKPSIVALCRRLGLEDELLETNQGFRRSFIVKAGRCVPVPTGWYLMAPSALRSVWRMPLLSLRGKFRVACEPLIASRRDEHDESVGNFIRRRFGQEAFTWIGQPMIGGMYSADPDRLSLAATLPVFRDMERQAGSVLAGLREKAESQHGAARHASGPRYNLFLTLRQGVAQLVERLAARLAPHVHIRCRATVQYVERVAGDDGSIWTVRLQDGDRLEAEALCAAVPTPQAALLLHPVSSDLAQALTTIPYESAATVNLGFRASDIPRPLDGFGFVVPSVEQRCLTGCTFSSVKFPGRAPQGNVLLRVFIGGALHRDVIELSDRQMEHVVQRELRKLLGIEATPCLISIRRFQRAMPQYLVGHLDRVARIEALTERQPGLFLTGNGYRGIGLPDCVASAEGTAERMMAFLCGDGAGETSQRRNDHVRMRHGQQSD